MYAQSSQNCRRETEVGSRRAAPPPASYLRRTKRGGNFHVASGASQWMTDGNSRQHKKGCCHAELSEASRRRRCGEFFNNHFSLLIMFFPIKGLHTDVRFLRSSRKCVRDGPIDRAYLKRYCALTTHNLTLQVVLIRNAWRPDTIVKRESLGYDSVPLFGLPCLSSSLPHLLNAVRRPASTVSLQTPSRQVTRRSFLSPEYGRFACTSRYTSTEREQALPLPRELCRKTPID